MSINFQLPFRGMRSEYLHIYRVIQGMIRSMIDSCTGYPKVDMENMQQLLRNCETPCICVNIPCVFIYSVPQSLWINKKPNIFVLSIYSGTPCI